MIRFALYFHTSGMAVNWMTCNSEGRAEQAEKSLAASSLILGLIRHDGKINFDSIRLVLGGY
jgi:hypothetical protein